MNTCVFITMIRSFPVQSFNIAAFCIAGFIGLPLDVPKKSHPSDHPSHQLQSVRAAHMVKQVEDLGAHRKFPMKNREILGFHRIQTEDHSMSYGGSTIPAQLSMKKRPLLPIFHKTEF